MVLRTCTCDNTISYSATHQTISRADIFLYTWENITSYKHTQKWNKNTWKCLSPELSVDDLTNVLTTNIKNQLTPTRRKVIHYLATLLHRKKNVVRSVEICNAAVFMTVKDNSLKLNNFCKMFYWGTQKLDKELLIQHSCWRSTTGF
jgi:hypothetical protein